MMKVGLDRSRVLLVNHSPVWASLFQQEAASLTTLLGDEIVLIDHVGSTAIPGIKAKPVIDILIQIPTPFISEVGEQQLLAHSFKKTFFQRRVEPMFSKTLHGNIATHNVHITQVGSILANALLNFRNSLLADSALARKYEELKLDLAGKYSDNRKAYYDAKIEFFESVVGKYFDPLPPQQDSI